MRLLRSILFLQCLLSLVALPLSAEENDRKEFNCSATDDSNKKAYRLTQYAGDKGVQNATWGTEYEAGKFASCGFTEGHKFKLTDMNLFSDRSAVVGKNMATYRGIGNHCSEGQLLLFNERSNIVVILNVHSAVSLKFQCIERRSRT